MSSLLIGWAAPPGTQLPQMSRIEDYISMRGYLPSSSTASSSTNRLSKYIPTTLQFRSDSKPHETDDGFHGED